MNLSELIAALTQPGAYPFAVDFVEVRQTHISVVFLAGPFAYKIKKPVELGFLDFRALEQRRHFCDEEVRLNRRLASRVYKGVVPVSGGAAVQFEGAGEVLEWAVKMDRLPDEATLEKWLLRGEVNVELMQRLARKLAEFHAAAPVVEPGRVSAGRGNLETVARNARENFTQSQPHIGQTLSRAVFNRLHVLTETSLDRLGGLIDRRAARDTHGDLRLDHVYLFPDQPPPDDLVVIDCIEFNERFRWADPVADMAFLVMDLIYHRHRDLAEAFADAYFEAAADAEGRKLLPFYTAYRSIVRGKVEGFKGLETEVPEAERHAAQSAARMHWLLALGELEEPGRRPCLVLVGGLPGAGKSTLARGLAEQAGFEVIRSDVVRKELAGAADDLYSPEWTERTYAECLRRAEELLFEGRRVLVDASFREEKRRLMFVEAAQRWGVPALFLHCRAEPQVARERLERRRGDVSDADWSIHQLITAEWQALGPVTQSLLRDIDTKGTPEEVLSLALDVLRKTGLQD